MGFSIALTQREREKEELIRKTLKEAKTLLLSFSRGIIQAASRMDSLEPCSGTTDSKEAEAERQGGEE